MRTRMSVKKLVRFLSESGVAEAFPLYVTGYVLVAESVLILLCLLFFGLDEGHVLETMSAVSIGMAFGIALLLLFKSPLKVTAATGAFTISLIWFVAILYGCVPYMIDGFTFAEAAFESISGFTTTGMSIVENVAGLNDSVLIWRATTGWAGGIGFIILFCLLMRYFGLDGRNIFVSDGLKHNVSHSLKSIKSLAMDFIIVYSALTALLAIALIVTGNDPIDSVCISMSTISTTGFSTLNADLTEMAMISKVFIGIFLFLSAMNFMSLFAGMTGLTLKPIREDTEIKQMLIWFTVSSTILFGILIQSGTMTFELEDILDTILMVMSIGTTTGFVFHDFAWPTVAMLFLSMLALIGGCRESPTGGIKVSRMAIIIKTIRRHISNVSSPNEVYPIRFGKTKVKGSVIDSVLVTTSLFLSTAIIGTMAIYLTGVEIVDSFYLCVSSLTTTGTGLYSVGNVASLPDVAKGIMCALMWIGRMEITLALTIFMPAFWKDFYTPIRRAVYSLRGRLTRTSNDRRRVS